MARIKILSQKIVNMIAAGEVVDRPSSVVKELIENSMDAGAAQITVETKGDGRELIKVTDDGMGMGEEDASIAFERHATSKIDTVEDIDSIRTMGFRGEALASIASVSEIEIVTRQEGEELATRLVLIGGEIQKTEKISAPVGTTIKVMNLFFNAPARAKFLKSRATEIRHITKTFATHSISQYRITMKLIRDRRVILSLPGVDNIEDRIGGILGRSFGENSIPVNVSDEYIQLCGFLSRPEEARSSSGYISIFINGRPVESKLMLGAICGAYGNTLRRNRYPTGVILIDISPAEVDFNVHPTKRQIRFRREKDVRNFVWRAVQSALTTRRMIPPLIARPPAGERRDFPAATPPMQLLGKKDILVSEPSPSYRITTAEPEAGVHPIVQIKRSYILAESDAEFYLIDQHAAHERVLYEEARSHLEGTDPVVQKLLFPEKIEVTPEEEDVIEEHLDRLRKMGFDLRKFGKRTFVVEAVPAHIKEAMRKAILTDVVDEVIETRSQSADIQHLLAAAFACKAAIKAGDKMSGEEIETLLERLFKSRMPFACPHGRPTMIRLSWDEIERRFLRR
ncbi:MAG: DNA mismatch repair endonuclease MutL [Candidatus Eisenbacteria bacterium]